MQILIWNELNATQRVAALARPAQRDAKAVAQATQTIIDAVRRDGDRALVEFTEKYDGVRLAQLAVTDEEFEAAERMLTPAQHAAIETAIGTVHAFHSVQGAPPLRVETAPGVICERVSVPVRAVGLYVPAGTAPLPSTAIMLGVPAAIANCPVRIMCTAPGRSGAADPAVLVAARKAGVQRIFKVGGAQAIAAMAYGTASIPKCDKLFGPGNAWVTAAKLLVANDAAGAAVDLPAGVTEVLVIADDAARADFVAADLLAQAEHSMEAQSLLVTTSAVLAQAVAEEVARQAQRLTRAVILRESIANMRIFIVDSLTEAFEVANGYAPEHLLLEIRNPRQWLAHVSAAGAVFLGSWSPESMGDYCSGPNHTLPTYGHARAYSGLSLEDFQKRITVQELSPAGLLALGPTAEVLAGLEGLDAHAAAVTIRLDALAGTKPAACPADALRSLARPEIVGLQPYSHAAWLPMLTRLHANEAPWRPAGDTTQAGLNRYPEPQPRALVERLAQVYGVPADSVLATHGSDEAIDLLSRIFLRAGSDSIVQCAPSFGMYQVAARIQGAAVFDVPLQRSGGWALDPERVFAAWRPGVKLVYLCSPNNPTGNLLDEKALDWLCTRLDGKAVVVIDEAYVEWSGRPSVTAWLARFPTLAILRTLSKAHALAGARIGALLANPGLIELAKRIAPPYSLAQSTIEAALCALQPAALDASRARIDALLVEREYCRERMRSSPLVEHVWPSDANFFLVDCSDAGRFMSRSVDAGLIVRDLRSNPALPRSLRVSVGTRAQNDALLASVEVT